MPRSVRRSRSSWTRDTFSFTRPAIEPADVAPPQDICDKPAQPLAGRRSAGVPLGAADEHRYLADRPDPADRVIIFGAGKLPQVMGDLAKGVKSFKAGLKDDEHAAARSQRRSDRGRGPAAKKDEHASS